MMVAVRVIRPDLTDKVRTEIEGDIPACEGQRGPYVLYTLPGSDVVECAKYMAFRGSGATAEDAVHALMICVEAHQPDSGDTKVVWRTFPEVDRMPRHVSQVWGVFQAYCRFTRIPCDACVATESAS